MRIRELLFVDVRGFRGSHRISFVDPITDEVRPITVIAGTNGTGKTTILDAIEEMLRFSKNINIWDPNASPFLQSILSTGLVVATLEIPSNILFNTLPHNPPDIVRIAVGNNELAQQILGTEIDDTSKYATYLKKSINGHLNWNRGSMALQNLRSHLAPQITNPLAGGMIYLPANRRIGPMQSGTVQPPDDKFEWVARITPNSAWIGSLEHFWVGQNYLDLEAAQNGEATHNLTHFVSLVEDVLGKNRKISIKRGRVLVPTHWRNGHTITQAGADMVNIDQLSSGEQQILFILGELARRRRDNAIIAIDEPELSLHPTLQRKLLWQLRQFALKTHSQLILATHSLEILNGVRASERIMLDQLEYQPNTNTEGDAHAANTE